MKATLTHLQRLEAESAPRRIAAGEVIDIGLCRLTASFGVGTANGDTDTKKSDSKRSQMAAQGRRRR